MEEFVRSKIVLLLDEYSKDSKRLHKSFEMAKAKCDVVIINDDGFLPEGINSVYEFFLDDFEEYKTYLGKPRYFNQILLPDYWEIEASMSKGTVYDFNKERARIYYVDSSNNKRRVKVVEWLDDNGMVRLSDHYNKYGVLFARTAFNAKGERVNKIFYSKNEEPIVYENFVTGAIILNYKGKERIFSHKADFVTFYMKLRGYNLSRVYYNSLWYSFYVSERMPAKEVKEDILFWQEGARDDIPGNMKVILDGKSKRTQIVIVQRKDAYERLIELGASPSVVFLKGFIYPFERENLGRASALIATNSDQIEHIEDLIKALPEIRFNITAITTMSSKLLELDAYDNVSLYPGADNELIDELFKNSDIYLDINKYNEISDAVYKAFLNNQIIMAFDGTKHNVAYVAKKSIYKEDEWERMAEDIRRVVGDEEVRIQKLELQKREALAESERSYALLK